MFLAEFEGQYQDTQKDTRAWNELKRLQLQFPNADAYITKFEDLV
jgi:hypothetical protein